MSESLKKQMDEVGYKQICQLIQGLEEGESLGNQTERTISDVMKIIVDTRYTGESDHQVSSSFFFFFLLLLLLLSSSSSSSSSY